jgi:ATP-dependent RNA helicase DeaD
LSFTAAHPSLRRAIAAKGYAEPTPVQAAVLEAASDRDLLVSAQTGSGKTVAFGLALAPRLLGDAERFEKAGAPRALIVTPTRELAQQVHRELQWLYGEAGARLTTCVGGMDPRREQQALAHGVHIVVGTPGRLCDHLERGALVLARIEAIVLDEADEMLDMGFREDIERLLDAAPTERRTLMFSATIPKPIATLAKRYQKGALRIAATGEGDRHRDIEYHAIPIVPRERDLAVVNLLRYHDAPGALVFCATRDGVAHLAANLSERGFSVAALSGDFSQRERNQALQALRDGRARVCVATDVAARGLDLPDLGLVIHADLPQSAQVLVHRSGRTGRAGKHGLAILIVADNARRYVERMLQTARVDVKWRAAPSAEDIRVKDQDQLVLEIRGLADEPSEDDRRVAQTLLGERTAEALVAALVRSRREARPSPEELTTPPSMRAKRPEPQRPARVDRRHEQVPFEGPDRRKQRPERPAPRERPQRGATSSIWFTINVGRSKNADPKWLIPLLCRRGNVTKRSIGKIEILARETRVEIAADAADAFAEAVRRPDPKDPRIHIEPLDAET